MLSACDIIPCICSGLFGFRLESFRGESFARLLERENSERFWREGGERASLPLRIIGLFTNMSNYVGLNRIKSD